MKTLQPILVLACLFIFSSCSKPEAKIVNRLEDMEEIMKDHMGEPAAGVEKLISYVEKHGPDTVKLTLEAGISLASIEGEGDKENRLKEVSGVLETAFKNFKGTAEKFGKAAEQDEKAKERLKEYSKKWEALGGFLSEVVK